MKRIVFTICTVLAIAALASCSKENRFAQENASVRNIPADWITLTFSADASKTTLNEGSIAWAEGDSIKIVWDNTEDGWNAGVVTNGTLTLAVKDTNDYYAVYPASTEVSLIPSKVDGEGYKLENDTLAVTITKVTDGSWAKANIMAAATTKDELQLGFRNVCSYLKFEVKDASIASVVFRSNDDSPATGTTLMTFDGAEPNFLDSLATTKVEVQADITGPGTYYLPVAPDIAWAAGFGVLVKDAEGVRKGTLTTKALGIDGRGKIMNMGCPEEQIHSGDWFIKADGTGDGTSWDNAGGARLLKDLLGNSLAPNNVTNGWRINGKTIRVAAGTYDLKDENMSTGLLTLKYTSLVTFAVKGGYSAASAGTDTTARDINANETIFTSSNPKTVSNNRMFTVNDAYLACNFDGITFTGIEPSGRGGIFYFNGSKGYGKCEFNDCTFKDITSTSYGVAINVNNNAVADFLTIRNCTFSNCKGTNGGAVEIELSTGTKGVLIKDCTFTGNTATATSGGGAIFAKGSKSVVTVEGCTFENNVAQTTGGGAIALSGDGTAKVGATGYITGCTFKGNKCATSAGALAGNGGAILQVGSQQSLLFMNGCTFDSNAAATNGPDLFASAGIASCIYNCTSATPINNSAANLGCMRCNGPAFFANNTFVVYGAAGATSGVITYGGSGAVTNQLINNILLCKSGSSVATGGASTKRNVTTYGHNVYGAAPNINYTVVGDTTDVSGITALDLWATAPAYNADGLLEWNGPASLTSFTPTTPADIEAAMKAYDPSTLVTKVGTAFFNWLVSIGAFDKDGAGNSRGTTEWWPGAYQAGN